HEAVKEYGELMNWDEIYAQGYCIANPDCKAAQLTGVKEELDIEDIKAYAMMAEKMFHLPIFYLEYSGKLGDLEAVKAVNETLENTVFIYGGGIQSAEQAASFGEFADIVVVGNALYEDINQALKTVEAVKK
ncbi:MAG TPA: geranylgeranylglyceryl/heptaprenylglyceryl phosphate synthase, partial [Chondromyces sp.]|nr:geranylgeranylglyceryl/heptaprenylglyceryl phosphate synthase [Chondromyces sp.]